MDEERRKCYPQGCSEVLLQRAPPFAPRRSVPKVKRIAGGHARHPPWHRRPCCLFPELWCFQSTDRKPFAFAMSIFDQILLLHFLQNL